MTQRNLYQSKKTSKIKPINTVETINSKNPGFGSIDQIFGNFSDEYSGFQKPDLELDKKKTSRQRQEFSIFNYQNYYEKELVKKQIKELTEQIKQEIILIKKADTALSSDLKEIESLTLQAVPEKPGIYHIRFLEIILRVLKSIREKIGESRTWLSAMISRKKKRGSLFLNLSKKKGTQYSLSQELQSARSVQ
ncbi:hypothetical protein COS31_01520 [Candidatus Roizmanbacteria bacterium CG02_land_8_20_14_3_00_36_15]|uniref:DUF5660 domain-containing protein n=2 Tax=Candidatus Roizmaniibacteriota TaxID=1752723 RepID=A0A2M8KKE6_9BACT|nr:MAG: hypothetical protein COS51_01765 [Candidatus Roizmanbacteria bacterium CG03_land_8_20_14_0_80_36_21]PIV38040.1 MAG: hypothetical protein COS31_01520 [Candidatus Roizmanbacteria bacterium CG02_land_8_20_14_3_00_36_15]PJA52699.1 MAG: hypothetical protein CO166_04545 [Candidatus Roizmanbacteria bacterium CG_4_9_14_3_um_filter_36_11]PJC81393.1 MAG: hypothetical protein CO007_05010 [Candidatus Roizmanbacteria bacterium CG_4_8_14_3_um_filter_36_10]PJE60385.1 MAG: hypothetical protein COU86_04